MTRWLTRSEPRAQHPQRRRTGTGLLQRLKFACELLKLRFDLVWSRDLDARPR